MSIFRATTVLTHPINLFKSNAFYIRYQNQALCYLCQLLAEFILINMDVCEHLVLLNLKNMLVCHHLRDKHCHLWVSP